MSSRPRSVGDVALAAAVGGAVLVSRWLPERLWKPLTRGVARAIRLARPSAGRLAADARLAAETHRDERDLAVERLASGAEARLHGLRASRVPEAIDGLNLDLSGREELHSALAAGRGAILWIAPFVWAPLIARVGLHRAGFAVSHLSRPTHGFGASPFAVTHLNPIWTRVEERFLARRVVMEPGAESAALRFLHRLLGEGAIVSISVGTQGAQVASVAFLGTELRLATGAVTLAASSGAPVLPVFTGRETNGRFRVIIDEPIHLPTRADRQTLRQATVLAYADRLEPWVRRWPGQWLG
jgi:lauroyl/myristoyl acyltransferase